MRTLFEYNELPKLDDAIRAKYHDRIVETILNDKDKYHNAIAEMIDYFIMELENADFIRMVEKITLKEII
jgi:mevalonate pyrophosphate decarboxylase